MSLKQRKEKEDKQKALETLEMKLKADHVFAEKQAERRMMQRGINTKLQCVS